MLIVGWKLICLNLIHKRKTHVQSLGHNFETTNKKEKKEKVFINKICKDEDFVDSFSQFKLVYQSLSIQKVP